MDRDTFRQAVSTATGGSRWDVFNHALYHLCEQHPRHEHVDEIVAKLVLIGRSYAAALERCEFEEESADDFYLLNAAPELMESDIDAWLDELTGVTHPCNETLPIILDVHKRLVDLFKMITGKNMRSLASKYLHFHVPGLFFIFDSRSESAAQKWAPQIKPRSTANSQWDANYHLLFSRCIAIVEMVQDETGTPMTPRELDNFLLHFPEGSIGDPK